MYDFDIIHYAHGDEFFFILTASQSVRWVSVVVFCCFFVIFLGGGGVSLEENGLPPHFWQRLDAFLCCSKTSN